MTERTPDAAAGATARPPRAGTTAPSVSDYRPERRAVLLCIALTFLTLGLYPAIWLIRRRPFLEGLNASRRLSPALPWTCVVLNVLSWVVGFIGRDGAAVANGLNLISGAVLLIATFRVATILSSDLRRTGRLLSVSYGATFFFSIFYLQYKINRAALIPARVPNDPSMP